MDTIDRWPTKEHYIWCKWDKPRKEVRIKYYNEAFDREEIIRIKRKRPIVLWDDDNCLISISQIMEIKMDKTATSRLRYKAQDTFRFVREMNEVVKMHVDHHKILEEMTGKMTEKNSKIFEEMTNKIKF